MATFIFIVGFSAWFAAMWIVSCKIAEDARSTEEREGESDV